MQQQIENIALQDRSYSEWSAKYDQAIEALTKISPAFIATAPSTSTVAWGQVFQIERDRERIERYLGRRSRFTSTFEPIPLSRDQLLNPVIQEVIQVRILISALGVLGGSWVLWAARDSL